MYVVKKINHVYGATFIVDIVGPNIEISGEDVIVVGTKRILFCTIITPLNMNMYWKCLNATSNPPKRYNSSLSILAYIEAKSKDHGEICTCIVQYESFETIASIMLNISSTLFNKKNV